MSFVCPDCKKATLEISRRLELPPDGRSDEITLQIVGCTECGFRGAAVYEESRRGALDSESWHHDGYKAAGADLNRLTELIDQCPAQNNGKCNCQSHRLLGQTNENGIWFFPNWIQTEGMFSLIWR